MFGVAEAILSFIRRQVGTRTDSASSTGSLHSKVGEVINVVGVNGQASGTTVMGYLRRINDPGGVQVVRSVQRGTTIITFGGLTINVPISAVVLGRTFVVATVRQSVAESAGRGMTAVALTTTTNLNLRRGVTGSTVTIEWQVVEYF